MPSRYVTVQLQPGIGQGILPDHRKMLPGIQYTIDWDTFQKLSVGARQNVIQVVSVINDTYTNVSGFVAAQTATGPNTALNVLSLLYTTNAVGNELNLAGFSAQGWTANSAGPTGVAPNVAPGNTNFALNGPSGERYYYVQVNSGVAAGDVTTWYDENNRVATSNRPTYTVYQDGQGTQYVGSSIVTDGFGISIGTKQGRFAGVALTTIASGYYGWIQTEGFCPAVSVSGNLTAGTTISVGGIGKAVAQPATATVVGANNVVTGTALANNTFGTTLTSGINTTVAVDLRALQGKAHYTRFLNKN